VRFDSRISKRTVIRYVTDGLLLRYLLADPLLSAYSVVVVDEAHERSLHSDVVLGLLKKVFRKRRDLKLVVTSATVNAEALKTFFDPVVQHRDTLGACIVSLDGKTHPVDVLYLAQPAQNYLRAAGETVLSIHRAEGPGDVLVFLPGSEEIDAVADMLRELHQGGDLVVLLLHGSLPTSQQALAFAPVPRGCRK
jgi:HrpA-like RNA helicase